MRLSGVLCITVWCYVCNSCRWGNWGTVKSSTACEVWQEWWSRSVRAEHSIACLTAPPSKCFHVRKRLVLNRPKLAFQLLLSESKLLWEVSCGMDRCCLLWLLCLSYAKDGYGSDAVQCHIYLWASVWPPVVLPSCAVCIIHFPFWRYFSNL